MKNDYTHTRLIEEVEKVSQRLKMLIEVNQAYPDAEIAYYNGAPKGLTCDTFSSFAVNKATNLQIEYHGNMWCFLYFSLYVEVGEAKTKIFCNPKNIYLWDASLDKFIKDNPAVTWAHPEKQMDDMGIDKKYLKEVYQHLIMLMAKRDTLDGTFIGITNKDELPKYILNKIIFI